jgi:hypothetical protein
LTSDQEIEGRRSLPEVQQRDLKPHLKKAKDLRQLPNQILGPTLAQKGQRRENLGDYVYKKVRNFGYQVQTSHPILMLLRTIDLNEIEDPSIIYISSRLLGAIDEVDEHGEVQIPLSDYLDMEARASIEESSANAVVECGTRILGSSALVLESTTDNDSVFEETKMWESEVEQRSSLKKSAT